MSPHSGFDFKHKWFVPLLMVLVTHYYNGDFISAFNDYDLSLKPYSIWEKILCGGNKTPCRISLHIHLNSANHLQENIYMTSHICKCLHTIWNWILKYLYHYYVPLWHYTKWLYFLRYYQWNADIYIHIYVQVYILTYIFSYKYNEHLIACIKCVPMH